MFDISGSSHLRGLNDAQRAAVSHDGGPLLVIAGAGTGKTRTLACRVAHLVARGIAPDRILLLTFTRRAAAEMLRRAGDDCGRNAAGRVWGGTFHSVAYRLLRMHGSALGLTGSFTVVDEADAADLMNLVRSDLGLGRTGRRFPRKQTLASIYSRVVNSQARLADVLATAFPWCGDDAEGIRDVFSAYTRRKRDQGLLDYDDLLLYLRALLRNPRCATTVASAFDHVLVDEYQDTNALQVDCLRALRGGHAAPGPCITAVGDDAQAIYSFRSASIDNMLAFPVHFPGAVTVTLDRNYRSSQPILDASNAVMAHAARRYVKDLTAARAGGIRPALVTCADEVDQSLQVCADILAARERGIDLRRQAVLFRTGHHSAHLEIELARRNIPFVKYGGLRFVEAAHVKDVVALLRILENPHDELAWFRVLLLIDGVGPATAARIMSKIGVRTPRAGGPSPLRRLADHSPRVHDELDALARALTECVDASVADQLDRLGRWCGPVFDRVYDHAPARMADLDRLREVAAAYRSRGRFVVDLTLDPPRATSDLAGPPSLDDDYLCLSTIHSAKGCEWQAVYVIHAADGMIPSDMSTSDEEGVEEERRLLYVALTRARDVLNVYVPLRYYHRRSPSSDAHGYAQPSRFLSADVRERFDRRSGARVGPDDTCDPPEPAEAGVDAFLAELWSG